MSVKKSCFIYHWYDPSSFVSQDITYSPTENIVGYGIDNEGKTICIKVKDFNPKCYIETKNLDLSHKNDFDWVISKIKSLCYDDSAPIDYKICDMESLYGLPGEKKLYLCCGFSCRKHIFFKKKVKTDRNYIQRETYRLNYS